MKKNINDMLRNIKSKKLTPEEKNYLWSNISHQLKLNRQKDPLRYFVILGYKFGYKKIIAAVTLAAFLVFGTATASAFDDVNPGDFLFPVDIAAETILLTLTFGGTEDVFRLRFAEERIDEVRALLALAESIEIEGTAGTSTDPSDSDGGEDDTNTTTDDDATTVATASSDNGSATEETESDTDDGTNENGVDLLEEEFLNNFDFNIDTVEDALLYALAHLEESKVIFASHGNANGVAAINSFIGQLNNLAHNHIDKLDSVAVTIEDGGNEDVKIKITASSKELKTKFEFTKKTKRDGSTTQRVTFRDENSNSSFKSDKNGGFKFSFNFGKRGNKKDDENDVGGSGNGDEDGDGHGKKGKVNVCHKGKNTISISKNALWAHIFHGDSLGSCGENGIGETGDDGDDDDTTAPVITDVAADPAETAAEVTWSTDEDAKSKVWYSATSPVSTESPTPVKESAVLTEDHVLILDGLIASTTYYYVVSSEDGSGNIATSSEHSFETLQQPDSGDTIAPVISNLTAAAATTSADVTWDTDEDADSTVYYSSTTPVNTDSANKVESTSLVTSHSLELSGLTASTTYYYVAVSADASGNTATSTEESFDTLSEGDSEPEDITAPVLSDIDASATTTEATVTWNTDENADSKVYYSTSSPVDSDTADSVESAGFVTSHSLELSSLTANTTYYYLVVSSDESENTATSTENSFTTTSEPEPEDTTSPVISDISATNIGSTTATINWSTDENSDSKIFYGTDDPLDTGTAISFTESTLVLDHLFDLTSLSPSTTYQYIVVSSDEAENTATSTQQAFTTTSE